MTFIVSHESGFWFWLKLIYPDWCIGVKLSEAVGIFVITCIWSLMKCEFLVQLEYFSSACFVPFGLYFSHCVCTCISVLLFYSDDCRFDITQPIWTAEVLKCQPVLTEIKHSCMTVWCPLDKHSLGFYTRMYLYFMQCFAPILFWFDVAV